MPRVAKDKVEKDIIENVKAVGEAPKSRNLRQMLLKKVLPQRKLKLLKKLLIKKILPEGLLPLLKPLERKKILLNLI